MERTPARIEAATLGYKEAGALLRLATSRGTRDRINGTEWRVLCAVMALTVSRSKAYDRVYVAQIAEMADLDRRDPTLKRTKRALKRLAALRILVYEPARRDRERSLVGFSVGDLPNAGEPQ